MAEGRFGTVINCMDGRAQLPVIEWVKAAHRVAWVDVITEPGVDKVLASRDLLRSMDIKEKVRISAEAHHSELVVVAGHHDCTANPVTQEEHVKQIRDAVEIVASWHFTGEVIGVWVDEGWNVHPVAEGR